MKPGTHVTRAELDHRARNRALDVAGETERRRAVLHTFARDLGWRSVEQMRERVSTVTALLGCGGGAL